MKQRCKQNSDNTRSFSLTLQNSRLSLMSLITRFYWDSCNLEYLVQL